MSSTLQRYKADFFKTIGHPLRLALLERLVEGPRTVSALAGDVEADLPTVSRHLSLLRTSGVVEAGKEGTSTIYRLADPRISDLLSIARSIMQSRLANTQEMLQSLESHA